MKNLRNSVQLIGRLSNAPEVRKLANGNSRHLSQKRRRSGRRRQARISLCTNNGEKKPVGEINLNELLVLSGKKQIINLNSQQKEQ